MRETNNQETKQYMPAAKAYSIQITTAKKKLDSKAKGNIIEKLKNTHIILKHIFLVIT